MKKFWKVFIESNRYKHLIGGFIIALFPSTIYDSIYVGLIAGGCLEFKDKAHGCKWDWIDFLFTVIGSVLGGLIRLII